MFVFSLDSATTPNDKVVKFKTDNIRKKKNISNTNTISKFKFIHLVIALVAFGIITIQPAVTVIITQQYINEAQININLLGKLSKVIFFELCFWNLFLFLTNPTKQENSTISSLNLLVTWL